MAALLKIHTSEGLYVAGSRVFWHSVCLWWLRLRRAKFSSPNLGPLQGKIFERGFKHRVYESSLYLFDNEIKLFIGPYSLRPPHPWPFEFQFNPTVDASELAGYFMSLSTPFNNERTQPLELYILSIDSF